jgi:DNA-binding NarL/FixJ family response regulator
MRGFSAVVRVLIVDDYEPFRAFARSLLGESSKWLIVGEASDGLQAVRKAEELQPDLIVLDIGLPTLNGIEAARRIRKLSPESKILFISQECAADVVQEALALGALGFVVKAHAGSELLPALAAVLEGKQFLSRSLAIHSVAGHADAKRAGQAHPNDLRSHAPEGSKIRRRHEVEFCPDDGCFVDAFARFIEAALRTGSAVIVIATESHLASLFHKLRADGIDVGAVMEAKRYIPLDVADTLATFMLSDWPDPVRFEKVARNLIMEAAADAKGGGSRSVAACGECAPTLLAKGKADAAIQVEHLWDEIARRYSVDILCGYPLNEFLDTVDGPIFQRICAEHSAVYLR